ncbi:MAG: hypothetical protein DBW67_01615 [SAR116 cluster bacterium]|nr:MAG: hypothetical protein DBW67_01615 [SAR116 cluster bacterium]HBQ22782.1 hypothetical protein [Alphaproteobacteria bacterium]HCJ62185.1 hypothetical protein [Alphaproteobacteria bacterium]
MSWREVHILFIKPKTSPWLALKRIMFCRGYVDAHEAQIRHGTNLNAPLQLNRPEASGKSNK